MDHCEPESLALSALGEPALTADDVAHLATCARCRADLDGAVRAVGLARGPEPAADVHPPPLVWERVAAELGLEPAVADGDPTLDAPVLPTPAAAGSPSAARRRRPRRSLLAVAAAAVVVAAGSAVAVAVSRDASTQIASTDLEPLDGSASGRAELVSTGTGLRLDVDVTGLRDTGGYFEVWLIDPSGAGDSMVSLGALPGSGGTTELAVPAGLDTDTYSVVDVSDEPYDGDPLHSRVSVTRGTLE